MKPSAPLTAYDIRERFARYRIAMRVHRTAARLAEVMTALSMSDPRNNALAAGAELARLRAAREQRRLAVAEVDLTRGSSILQVLWSLPDDL